MTDRLSIAVAQLNPTVGAISQNVAKIREARAKAAAKGADIVITPELSVIGYPPEDLVLKPSFQQAAMEAVNALARDTGGDGPALITGSCWVEKGRLHNAVFLMDEGRILARRIKHDLPNYGVFDEKRIFAPGPVEGPVQYRGLSLGLMVCEDMWFPHVSHRLAGQTVDIVIVPTCSPYETGKYDNRFTHARKRIAEIRAPLLFVNQLGGQDEVVFDGASFAMDADGKVLAQLPAWSEHMTMTQWRRTSGGWTMEPAERFDLPGENEAIWRAMCVGLRDYVSKNRFSSVVIGLSGGIDSAVTAAVAVDALGPDAVHCIMMPSRYTSPESLEDAAGTAGNLGVGLDTVAIEPAVEAFEGMLADPFAGKERDTTEENIQSRIRGILLMAYSNKFGHMVVTTGNKSEMSVGYATQYGDMCGGYSVLKDVYKTKVFELARWRNQTRPDGVRGPDGPVVPERIIDKPPSAELRANQTDADSLPSYDTLDDILQCLIEHEMSAEDIIARGHDAGVVARVEHLLYIAEYKRRQAPPGVKITPRNLGRDRRYPITNAFRTARVRGSE